MVSPNTLFLLTGLKKKHLGALLALLVLFTLVMPENVLAQRRGADRFNNQDPREPTQDDDPGVGSFCSMKNWIMYLIMPALLVICMIVWLIELLFKLLVEIILLFVKEIGTTLFMTLFGFIQTLLSPVGPGYLNNYDALHAPMFTVLMPFYILQIIWVGLLFIFSSISPSQRAKAKDSLWKACVSMVLVTVSPEIFKILYAFGDYLTDRIFDALLNVEGISDPVLVFGAVSGWIVGQLVVILATLKGGGMLMWLINLIPFVGPLITTSIIITVVVLIAFIVLAPVIIIGVRYATVAFFYVLFPVTVFMHFFPPTRKLGGKMLGQSIIWILIKPVMALIVVATFAALISMLNVDTATGAVSGWNGGTGHAPPTAGVPAQFQVNSGDYASGGGGMSDAVYKLFYVLAAPLVVLTGMVLLTMVPLMMTATMRWIGGAMAASGMYDMAKAKTSTATARGFTRLALGGALMGNRSSGMVSAASTAAWMQAGGMAGPALTMGGMSAFLSGTDMQAGSGGAGGGSSGKSAGARWAQTKRSMGEAAGRFNPFSAGGLIGAPTSADWKPGGSETGRGYPGPDGRGVDSPHGDVTRAGSPSRGQPGSGTLDAGKISGSVSGGGTAAKSPISDRPFGTHPEGSGDQYTKLTGEHERAFKDKRTGSYFMLPMLDVYDRARDVYQASDHFSQGLAGAGKSCWAAMRGGETSWRDSGRRMGAGLISMAKGMGTISFLFPVRLTGTVIYNVAPQLLPPTLQPMAYRTGSFMAGLGFRQIGTRSEWRGKIGWNKRQFYEAENTYNKACQVARAQGEAAGLDGKDLQMNIENNSTVRESRSRMEKAADNIAGVLDQAGHHGTLLGGTTDKDFYARQLDILEKKDPEIFKEYQRRRFMGRVKANEIEGAALLVALDEGRSRLAGAVNRGETGEAEKISAELAGVSKNMDIAVDTMQRTGRITENEASAVKEKVKASIDQAARGDLTESDHSLNDAKTVIAKNMYVDPTYGFDNMKAGIKAHGKAEGDQAKAVETDMLRAQNSVESALASPFFTRQEADRIRAGMNEARSHAENGEYAQANSKLKEARKEFEAVKSRRADAARVIEREARNAGKYARKIKEAEARGEDAGKLREQLKQSCDAIQQKLPDSHLSSDNQKKLQESFILAKAAASGGDSAAQIQGHLDAARPVLDREIKDGGSPIDRARRELMTEIALTQAAAGMGVEGVQEQQAFLEKSGLRAEYVGNQYVNKDGQIQVEEFIDLKGAIKLSDYERQAALKNRWVYSQDIADVLARNPDMPESVAMQMMAQENIRCNVTSDGEVYLDSENYAYLQKIMEQEPGYAVDSHGFNRFRQDEEVVRYKTASGRFRSMKTYGRFFLEVPEGARHLTFEGREIQVVGDQNHILVDENGRKGVIVDITRDKNGNTSYTHFGQSIARDEMNKYMGSETVTDQRANLDSIKKGVVGMHWEGRGEIVGLKTVQGDTITRSEKPFKEREYVLQGVDGQVRNTGTTLDAQGGLVVEYRDGQGNIKSETVTSKNMDELYKTADKRAKSEEITGREAKILEYQHRLGYTAGQIRNGEGRKEAEELVDSRTERLRNGFYVGDNEVDAMVQQMRRSRYRDGVVDEAAPGEVTIKEAKDLANDVAEEAHLLVKNLERQGLIREGDVEAVTMNWAEDSVDPARMTRGEDGRITIHVNMAWAARNLEARKQATYNSDEELQGRISDPSTRSSGVDSLNARSKADVLNMFKSDILRHEIFHKEANDRLGTIQERLREDEQVNAMRADVQGLVGGDKGAKTKSTHDALTALVGERSLQNGMQEAYATAMAGRSVTTDGERESAQQSKMQLMADVAERYRERKAISVAEVNSLAILAAEEEKTMRPQDRQIEKTVDEMMQYSSPHHHEVFKKLKDYYARIYDDDFIDSVRGEGG